VPAAQGDPLRRRVARAHQDPRAENPEVPRFGADPVPGEFDALDLYVVVGPGAFSL
jgi:hypothetical protein